MPDDCLVALQSRPVVPPDRWDVSSNHTSSHSTSAAVAHTAGSKALKFRSFRGPNSDIVDAESNPQRMTLQHVFSSTSVAGFPSKYSFFSHPLFIVWVFLNNWLFFLSNSFLKGRQTEVSLLELSLFLQIKFTPPAMRKWRYLFVPAAVWWSLLLAVCTGESHFSSSVVVALLAEECLAWEGTSRDGARPALFPIR